MLVGTPDVVSHLGQRLHVDCRRTFGFLTPQTVLLGFWVNPYTERLNEDPEKRIPAPAIDMVRGGREIRRLQVDGIVGRGDESSPCQDRFKQWG